MSSEIIVLPVQTPTARHTAHQSEDVGMVYPAGWKG